MNVLGDLVARERRSDAVALRAPDRRATDIDYRRFCTNAWKTGNFLSHVGVRRGRTVAVDPTPTPETLCSLFGAALLGAPVALGDAPDDARAWVGPAARADDAPGGCKRVVYGGDPPSASDASFEREVWSENPVEPPDRVSSNDVALRTVEGGLSHADVLDAAARLVERWGLDANSTVAVRAPLSHPGAVVGGVVAPILAGGTVLLPDAEAVGGYAVAEGAAPEPARLAPDDVLAPSEMRE